MRWSGTEKASSIRSYFLRDPGDDIWVRRHLPATIARIPAQKSVDILIAALKDPTASSVTRP